MEEIKTMQTTVAHSYSRWSGLFAVCLLALLASQSVRASHITVDIHSDVGLFYQELAPFGEWISTPQYGHIWIPNSTPLGWRPYTLGHWSYNERVGWIWISYWQWGWATFHYGRWINHPDYGWAWIPGTDWAPAWVAWRSGNGWIGWAPLPPEAAWEDNKGLTGSMEKIEKHIPFHAWSFVPQDAIFSRELHTREIIMSARNVTVLPLTKPVTRYEAVNHQVINHGADIEQLRMTAGLATKPVRLVDVTYPAALEATKVGKDELALFRPTMDLTSEIEPPKPGAERYPGQTAKQMQNRHRLTLKAMQLYHEAERKAMEQLHARQLSQPPAQPDIEQQQSKEREAVTELHRWEQHVLDRRLQLERSQVESRSK
ncbi:MAG: hypothetical protein A2V90_00355 [Gammaproteobacteria bacterium RBG_16_57_12]|nr:MAG: hypothetical protein A2V90_00355 [Gammaproteobacteria bacterium RBG_16_57_12]